VEDVDFGADQSTSAFLADMMRSFPGSDEMMSFFQMMKCGTHCGTFGFADICIVYFF
jgi:hypothetical protein